MNDPDRVRLRHPLERLQHVPDGDVRRESALAFQDLREVLPLEELEDHVRVAHFFGDVVDTPGVSLDPSRVAAQVVSGIGFLGAGTIIFQREIVRGLTTAASVWAVAAIGLAVGGGLYLPAFGATILTLLILAGLKPLENRFFLHRRQRILTVIVERGANPLFAIESAIEGLGLRLERILIQPDDILVMQEKPYEAIVRYLTQQYRFTTFVEVIRGRRFNQTFTGTSP